MAGNRGIGITRLSIAARLVLLSAALLLILVGTNIYLNRELNEGADALAAEAHYVEVLRTANAAEKSFGDLKYWLTDLAVSLLNLSEQRAREAKSELDGELTALEAYDAESVRAIRGEVENLMTRAFEAVDAYTNDRRVIGNSLMAVARTHIGAVDERLMQMLAKLRQEAAEASVTAQRRSARAVGISWGIVIAAGMLALALTVLILRSIVVPLGRIDAAMRAITSGRTDVDIPPAGEDELGAMARTLALFRDGLTERNRLAAEREQAARRLEIARDEANAAKEILQVTFEHMAQGVAMFDRDGRLVAWNTLFGELMDLPSDLLTGAPSYADFIRYLAKRGDFGASDPEEEVRERIATLDRPFVGERVLPDGRVLEIRRNPVPGGGFVSIYTDITDRKRAQAEIELARNRLSDAIQSISDGFALWDQDDRLITFNERCRQLLKLPDAFVAGTRFETLLGALAGRRAENRGRAADATVWLARQRERHRLPSSHEELQLEDGTWLRFSSHATQEGGVVTTWADISVLKNRELELAELVARLKVARDQATDANRTKSAFLANMSHELRTPLNAIIGYSEILKEESRDRGVEEFLPDIDRIEVAGRHLLGVINDILDLSKIEAGRTDVYLERIDLTALVGEVQSIIRPLVAKNGNQLEIRCAADIGQMRSDLTKVKQSLLNLLSNSSKFTTGGRIELDVWRAVGPTGPTVCFKVADTGIGMTEAQLGQLFKAFSQADTTTTKRFGGTGLGLAITKHFCLILGGDVTVESEPGKGSSFTITLPDRTAEEAAASLAPRVAKAAEGAATILVVDDDPAALDLLSMSLGKEGYRVIPARSGEEALQQARLHRPRVITLDVLMPHMDGWSVLMALKADPALRDIPVIMVTVLKERGMAFSLGAAEFMTKPVDRAGLAAMLQRYCGTVTGATVLVVDDDSGSRNATRRVLEKLGLKGAEVGNGLEALQWLEDNPAPALILLDLMMPVMDGFGFLEEFERRPALRAIPVVVLTGKRLTSEEAALLTGRTQRVMTKEATSGTELGAAIRKCLEARGIEPEAAASRTA